MEPLGRGASAHTHSGNPVFYHRSRVVLGGGDTDTHLLVTVLTHTPHHHVTTPRHHLNRLYCVSLVVMVVGREVLNTSPMSSLFISL